MCQLTHGHVDVHHGVDGRVSERRLDRVRGVQAPEFSHVAELSLALGDHHSAHLQDGKLPIGKCCSPQSNIRHQQQRG